MRIATMRALRTPWCRWRLLATAFAVVAGGAAAEEPVALWHAAGSACKSQELAKEARLCRVVAIDPARLAFETPRVSVWLPGSSKALVLSRRAGARSAHGFVWDGQGAGFANGAFSVVDKAIVGDIMSSDGRLYRLRYAPTRRYVLEEMDLSKLDRAEPDVTPLPPPPAAPPPPPSPGASASEPAPAPTQTPTPAPAPAPAPARGECASETPTRIDVMVLYTPATIARNTTEAHMQARVNLAALHTNEAFTESGVNVQIRTVHLASIDYNNETGPLEGTLDLLINAADTGADADTLNSVHAWRDAFNADLVMFIVDLPGTAAGLAKTYSADWGTWFASKAFAVVTELGLSESGAYYFTHELGHLMGSQHDATSGGAFAYSHGQRGAATRACPGWGTIMAQPVCDKCMPLRRWSSPALQFCGQPQGVAGTNDNALSLNTTRSVIAKFRCGAPE